MEDLVKSPWLTIKGCRHLLEERHDPQEVELVRQILPAAEAHLKELETPAERKVTERPTCRAGC